MLGQAAGVAVEDDGLGGDFHDVIDGAEAAGHVDELNVGLALGGGVTQGGDPHGVELVGLAVLQHGGLLGDQAGDAAVGLDGGDQALHADDLLQAAAAEVGHGQLGAAALIQLLKTLVLGVGELDELAAVLCQQAHDLVTDGLLEAVLPVVAVDDVGGVQGTDGVGVAQGLLLDDGMDACDIFENGLALLEGQQGEALVGGNSLVGQDADDQLAQLLSLADDGDMAGVDHIGGEAHVDGAVLDLAELGGDDGQILGGVDLCAQAFTDVEGLQGQGIGDLVQSSLGVALAVVGFAELCDLGKPGLPLGLVQLVQGLGLHGGGEELHAHGLDLAVLDNGLEVLVGQGQGGADLHAAVGTCQHILQHADLEDQVAVHQDDVVIQVLPGQIDGVDVVGLCVEGIVDEGVVQGQVQAAAVVDQHVVIVAGGHDHFLDAGLGQKLQLAAENGLAAGNFRHALGMLRGQNTHTMAQAGVQN